MPDYHQLWKPHAIGHNQTLDLCLGSLHLWVHRGREEWYIAHENEPENEDRFSVGTSDALFDTNRDWTRWTLGGNIENIQLKPRLPDRPLIVRPEMPMCLMPKQSVQFFVGIPIWMAITFGAKQEQVTEVPTMPLSNSWFGSFTEGELCYAMKTTAKLHQEDLILSAQRAVFPVEIRNASHEKLNFERLCLRPQFLNIYQGDSCMWTSKARVSYRGEEVWSRMVYSSLAPDYDNAKRLLGKARESLQRGALLKTFDGLKQRVDLS